MVEKTWTMEDIIGPIDGYLDETQKTLRRDTFDVRKLPAEKVIIGKKDYHYWVGFLIVFIIFTLVPPSLQKGEVFHSTPGFWIVISAAGCFCLLVALRKIFFKCRIIVSKDEVIYSKKGLFGKKQWTEKLSSYKGILRQVWGGAKSRKSFELILYHNEKDKQIRLLQLPYKKPAHKAWQAFANALNKPMLYMKAGDNIEYKGNFTDNV